MRAKWMMLGLWVVMLGLALWALKSAWGRDETAFWISIGLVVVIVLAAGFWWKEVWR